MRANLSFSCSRISALPEADQALLYERYYPLALGSAAVEVYRPPGGRQPQRRPEPHCGFIDTVAGPDGALRTFPLYGLRAVKAGVVYFLLMFAVGWILGAIRELWAAPHLGRVEATLLEAIIMLIAMIVAARWVIRRFEIPQTTPATTAIDLVALGVLIPAEIAGVVFVRRLSFQDYFSSFLTAPA